MSNIGNGGFGVADQVSYNELEIDANERTSGTQNHPIFVLQKELYDVVGMKAIEIEFPFSYYVINSTNNTFTLTEPTGTNTPITITLTPGNYTSTTLATELANELTNSSGVGIYTVTYDSSTQKFTVMSTIPENFVLTFGGPTDNGATNPRLWLGFNAGANTATAGTLVAPNVAQISGPNYLYLCSNNLGILNNETLRRGDLAQSGPILAKIQVNTNPGGIIFWRDPDPEKYFEIDSANITTIDCYVCTAVGGSLQEVDFNGVPFSLKIGFITADTQSVKRSAGVQLSGRVKRLMVSQ